MRPVNNISGGQVGRSRLLDLLLRDGRQRLNNGTVAGGLAHVLQQGMRGYQIGQEREAQQKAAADETAAMNAMTRGMSAQQWQPPAGDVIYDGPNGQPMSREDAAARAAPAGGYAGGISALQGLGADNAAAGRLTSQLLMGKMERDQAIADRDEQRAYDKGLREEERDWKRDMFELEQKAAMGRISAQEASQLRLYREKAAIDQANPGPETFGQPMEVMGPDGKPMLIQAGNRGSQMPLDGLSPMVEEPDALGNFDPEQKLRKEYAAQTKDFVKVRDAYGRIVQSARDPSPAGDLALIFNYMKVLDPGSVVRESEFATAESAAAWLQKSEEAGMALPLPISSGIRRLASGQRLAPEQRVDFVGRARGLYEQQLGFQRALADTYTSLAKEYGLDPQKVVYDLSQGFLPEPIPQQNQTGQGAGQPAETPPVSVNDSFDPLTADVNTASKEELLRIIESLSGPVESRDRLLRGDRR